VKGGMSEVLYLFDVIGESQQSETKKEWRVRFVKLRGHSGSRRSPSIFSSQCHENVQTDRAEG